MASDSQAFDPRLAKSWESFAMDDWLDLRRLLVIGGARSGKSRYGQTCAEQSGKQPVLIATAEAGDAEMAKRIAAHKAARGAHWRVVEERFDLVRALHRELAEDKVLLVDCLTLWLSNVMHLGRDPETECGNFGAGDRGAQGTRDLRFQRGGARNSPG